VIETLVIIAKLKQLHALAIVRHAPSGSSDLIRSCVIMEPAEILSNIKNCFHIYSKIPLGVTFCLLGLKAVSTHFSELPKDLRFFLTSVD
jgi:hypothetical protein